MKHKSIVVPQGLVSVPDFKGERVYMLGFKQSQGLPKELSRWSDTVTSMLDGIETDETIFLMIDQKELRAGELHRRPGVHIDGYWQVNGYAGGYGSSIQAYGGNTQHRGNPWELRAHGGNPGHLGNPGPRHGGGGHMSLSGWDNCDFSTAEGLILLSNEEAAVAYSGEFSGDPKDGGDYAHLDLSGLAEHKMEANRVYHGNVSMLHETRPVTRDCRRTLVRLNVPGWTPKAA